MDKAEFLQNLNRAKEAHEKQMSRLETLIQSGEVLDYANVAKQQCPVSKTICPCVCQNGQGAVCVS